MAEPMRIGHITWITYPNFGTYLQAYALQKAISCLGYESRIIDDIRFTYLYASKRHLIRKAIGLLIHPAANFRWFKSRHELLSPFNRFKKRYLIVDKGWKTEESLVKRYNGFVCGSDQIWSPLLPSQHGGFYFASFAKKNKIAYAPSLGSTSIPEEQKSLYKGWLDSFDAIAMREDTASVAVSNLLGKGIPTVLDPTLLLTGEEWSEIAKEPKTKHPYILCYFLTYNKKYIDYTRNIGKVLKLDTVFLGDTQEVRELSDVRLKGTGPAEFLGLVRNAEMVITDSFHGTIFSIVFNRRFVTLKRFKNSDPKNQNSRIENLFRQLGIDGFYSEESIDSGNVEFVSDFGLINESLSQLKSKSIAYLQKSLCKI